MTLPNPTTCAEGLCHSGIKMSWANRGENFDIVDSIDTVDIVEMICGDGGGRVMAL